MRSARAWSRSSSRSSRSASQRLQGRLRKPAPTGCAGIFEEVCGIVGYVGRRPVQDLLLAGLSKLEYRGYDSAGISVIAEDRIEAVRAVGNLSALQAKLGREAASGPAVALAERPATTGIGHTRWATHGRVSEANAHPHYDSEDRIHVVVNGIVENYMALKQRLVEQGTTFTQRPTRR